MRVVCLVSNSSEERDKAREEAIYVLASSTSPLPPWLNKRLADVARAGVPLPFDFFRLASCAGEAVVFTGIALPALSRTRCRAGVASVMAPTPARVQTGALQMPQPRQLHARVAAQEWELWHPTSRLASALASARAQTEALQMPQLRQLHVRVRRHGRHAQTQHR